MTILTDARGVPLEKPRREDYEDAVDWMRAVYAWKDRVANVAHESFDATFRRALR